TGPRRSSIGVSPFVCTRGMISRARRSSSMYRESTRPRDVVAGDSRHCIQVRGLFRRQTPADTRASAGITAMAAHLEAVVPHPVPVSFAGFAAVLFFDILPHGTSSYTNYSGPWFTGRTAHREGRGPLHTPAL